MLTTIKLYAYYTVKIHKNKNPKKIKRSVSPESAFALSTFRSCSWYCQTDRE